MEEAAEDASYTLKSIVLEIEGLVLGLWVDAATDVLTVDTRQMEDLPDLATQAGYDAVRHVVRRDEGPPIMILAIHRLVENMYRSALPGVAMTGELQ